MNRTARFLLGIAIFAVVGIAQADVLELHDGRQFAGSLQRADGSSIQFESEGEILVVPVDQARSLRFGEATEATPPEIQAGRPAPAAHATLAAAATSPHAPTPVAPPAAAPSARTIEIPVGTLLQVRMGDTVDPRIGAEGDRFAGLLEIGLVAEGVTVIPARTRVYGVVSAARTQGPIASRLKLELTEVMLGGAMLPIVSGTHNVVALPGAAPGPASVAPARPDRIPAGTVLEFRLLQSMELVER